MEGNKEKIPTGYGKFNPHNLPEKNSGRWNKIFGYRDAGNINEAGTSDALECRECQQYPECGICADGQTCILVYFNIRN
jgi:hypothetical protein